MADYKVVDIEQLEAGLTATADAIRAKTGSSDEIPWNAETGMAANIEEVFDAAKQNAYDVFWDIYQYNGTRDDYRSAFAGAGWTDETFKPKYDIKPTKLANSMFFCTRVTDLPKLLTEYGIEFDTSKATNLNTVFGGSSYLIKAPTLSTVSTTNINTLFDDCRNLESIEKLILKDDGSQAPSNAFRYTYKLVDIVIEGVIGQNGFNFQWSTLLSKASILSIINALSTTTTGLTVTFSLAAVNNAFETAEGVADGSTSAEWTVLKATKSNWNIALV